MTITLYWWHIPIGMLFACGVILWKGSQESGMFGGIFHVILSLGLAIGAICTTVVGCIKP